MRHRRPGSAPTPRRGSRRIARKPLILWGGTGFAIVLEEFAARCGFELRAILDANPALVPPFPTIPSFTGDEAFARWSLDRPAGDVWFAVAIGGDRGDERLAITARLRAAGLRPATLIHPTAFVARSANVGSGSFILAQSAVAARATLGICCVVNTRASVDHECVIEAGVHIGPGATLAGGVIVGARSFVASGATIAPNVQIGEDSVIGAGSVVLRDIPSGVVASGNPARVFWKRRLRVDGVPAARPGQRKNDVTPSMTRST